MSEETPAPIENPGPGPSDGEDEIADPHPDEPGIPDEGVAPPSKPADD